MNGDFEDLKIKIKEAVAADFQRILKEINDEKLYAVALVTDSDCITLFLAANTCEYLRKTDIKNSGYEDSEEAEYLSYEEYIETLDYTPETFKWIPDEWGYSDGNDSKLNEIGKLLYAKVASLAGKRERQEYQNSFLSTVTSAFKELIQSGAFGASHGKTTFFVSMSDDDRAVDIESKSAQMLNPEALYEEFIKSFNN